MVSPLAHASYSPIVSPRFSSQDCLDRTNVVQSAFAKFVLTQQLKDIGVLSDKESIDDHEDFMSVFRNRKLSHVYDSS